jgi:hypothetical protein
VHHQSSRFVAHECPPFVRISNGCALHAQ